MGQANYKLDVLLVTHNHEKHILQALQSLQSQTYRFPFVVKVFDDCSSDSTLAIIESFAKTSNLQIELFPSEKNLGIRGNYERAFDSVKNDFVAILEGDDYWLDARHLEQNVENLIRYSSVALSFSSLMLLIEDEHRVETKPYPSGQFFSARDLARDNFIGNFSCCVYKVSELKMAIQKFKASIGYDWLFNLLVAEDRLIMRSYETFTVYRIHCGGTWSGAAPADKIKGMMEAIQNYDSLTDYKYTDQFKSLESSLIRNANFSRYSKSRFLRSMWRVAAPILPDSVKKFLKALLNV